MKQVHVTPIDSISKIKGLDNIGRATGNQQESITITPVEYSANKTIVRFKAEIANTL